MTLTDKERQILNEYVGDLHAWITQSPSTADYAQRRLTDLQDEIAKAERGELSILDIIDQHRKDVAQWHAVTGGNHAHGRKNEVQQAWEALRIEGGNGDSPDLSLGSADPSTAISNLKWLSPLRRILGNG